MKAATCGGNETRKIGNIDPASLKEMADLATMWGVSAGTALRSPATIA
jgi:hypothetical protein